MKPPLIFNPPIIAHRGASKYAPENTLAAFRKVKELGINWLEFDVMLTSDNQAVVIHDETLDRTTNCKGKVCDFELKYLQTLDVGTWFDQQFSTERLPTLTEVLALLQELNLSANIEIKAQLGWEKITAKTVLNVIKQHWKNVLSPPLISSFSFEILQEVRKISSDCLIAVLMHKWHKNWQEICDNLQASAVDVNYKILTAARVAEIKQTDRKLLAYTVNNLALAQKLLSWGVDAVFSDCPKEMLHGF